MPVHPAVMRATISAQGVLLAADLPLLALQRQAGGDLDAPLAVPQLAAVARLASRLGIAISRPVVAASDQGDIEMWVRAKPEGEAVQLSVIEWNERPLPAPAMENGSRESDIAALAGGWTWQIDTLLRFQIVMAEEDAGATLPESPPPPGSRFSAYFQLQGDEEGDMAMLRGFAQRRAFRNQQAVLVSDPERRYSLAGFPLFDLAGQLLGYRGKATPVDEAAARAPDPQSTFAYPGEFGRRLDRSLRQPLGRIIANADTISAQLKGPLRADYAGYASDIAAAGRHLMALVDDLADLQAIDRPDFTVTAEEIDLADLGRRAAGLLNVKAIDGHISIFPPDISERAPATGEFRRVLQILVNLVGNAVRYSPEGGQVRIATEMQGRLASVTVVDQGPGVADGDRERIFDKFERLGRDDAAGSGLGLYISRRLARAMGGDIRVGGDAGEGARFVLTLPARA